VEESGLSTSTCNRNDAATTAISATNASYGKDNHTSCPCSGASSGIVCSGCHWLLSSFIKRASDELCDFNNSTPWSAMTRDGGELLRGGEKGLLEADSTKEKNYKNTQKQKIV